MENNPTQPTSQPITPVTPELQPTQPQSQPMQPLPSQPTPQPKGFPVKKILIILGAVIVGIIVLVFAIIFIVSATSQHMKCTSSIGDIDIMYNDTQVTGYAGNGISYDLDYQQAYSRQVGINSYLDEFEAWFQTNTGGTCTR